jgi:SpoVK/Ycf46/Vps4 family AAA+-type ATPase
MSHPSTDRQRLEHCLDAGHPCISIITREESHAVEMIDDIASGSLNELWYWTAVRGVYAGLLTDPTPIPDTENPAAALYYLAERTAQGATCVVIDLIPHLQQDPITLRALREAIASFRLRDKTLILLDHGGKLPPVIAAEVTHLSISLPDEDEIERIIRSTLRRMHKQKPVKIDLTKHELAIIIRDLSGLTRTQAEQIIADAVTEDRVFNAADINTILARKRQRLAADGVLEYVQTPLDLNEIGGLRALKRWLRQRRDALSEKARKFGITAPRGVLMLGVQGAGKSLCAKAIATAWQRPLLRLDPGTLYDRYIGESEARLRAALDEAERMAPIIMWIDEIEKGFASAAARSVDGGLSQRMFGCLLTWMQEHAAPVFLVATANNIEALPPELLRKGRFDEIFFVDLPNKGVRKQIFSIHLRKRSRDPDTFDLDALAEASDGYSGAEIEQAIVSGLYDAFAAGSKLTNDHIITALETSPPLSVTMAEEVAELRQWARTRCTPAD